MWLLKKKKYTSCYRFYFFGHVGQVLLSLPPDTEPEEWDISDYFSEIAQGLGYEGKRDAMDGLWETCRLYEDDTVLVGDFLSSGIPIEIQTYDTSPFPFTELSHAITYAFTQLCEYQLTRIEAYIPQTSVARNIGWPEDYEDIDAVYLRDEEINIHNFFLHLSTIMAERENYLAGKPLKVVYEKRS